MSSPDRVIGVCCVITDLEHIVSLPYVNQSQRVQLHLQQKCNTSY